MTTASNDELWLVYKDLAEVVVSLQEQVEKSSAEVRQLRLKQTDPSDWPLVVLVGIICFCAVLFVLGMTWIIVQ